jgi:hypothetical protein
MPAIVALLVGTEKGMVQGIVFLRVSLKRCVDSRNISKVKVVM